MVKSLHLTTAGWQSTFHVPLPFTFVGQPTEPGTNRANRSRPPSRSRRRLHAYETRPEETAERSNSYSVPHSTLRLSSPDERTT